MSGGPESERDGDDPPSTQPPLGAAGDLGPGGGTATWAAVLALFGGFYSGAGQAVVWLSPPDSPLQESMTYVASDEQIARVITAAGLLCTAALLIGPLLLLRRRPAGRHLVVVGSALTIPLGVATTIPGFATPVTPITDLWALIFPVVTLLLALSSETTAWLHAERAR